MDRRRQIRMSEAELAAFLDAQRTLVCATLGRRGRPHLAALWYVPVAGRLDCWTYAASQKVRNLERDPRCTLQVEAGRDRYDQLRGVMVRAEAAIHRDLETVTGVGLELARRYSGGADVPEQPLRRQAAKRVALEFRERRRASWDHRKL